MMAVRVIYSEEWGQRLELDHDVYMERLYESVDSDYQDEHDEDVVDVTGNFYCGCSTCERRASWTFLMIRAAEAVRDGIMTLESDEAEAVTDA